MASVSTREFLSDLTVTNEQGPIRRRVCSSLHAEGNDGKMLEYPIEGALKLLKSGLVEKRPRIRSRSALHRMIAGVGTRAAFNAV